MSNPSVIVLSECLTAKGDSFRIEDNIGEAIHLHHGDIRIDFTVQDFLTFSSMLQDALSAIVKVEGFCLEQFDPIFLAALGDGLCDLESVAVEQLSLAKLEVYTDSWIGQRLRPLPESRVAYALKGLSQNYMSNIQENLYGQSNIDRLSMILEEVRSEGYPYKERYIVVFNDQNIIRDGQHRAAALYFLNGNQEIPIIRLWFRNGRFRITRYPWLRSLPGRLCRSPRYWLNWCYRYCRKLGGKVLRHLNLR